MADQIISKKLQKAVIATADIPADPAIMAPITAGVVLPQTEEFKPVDRTAPEAVKTFAVSALDTWMGDVLTAVNSPDRTVEEGWRDNSYVKEEVDMGLHLDPHIKRFMEGAANPRDWKYRTAVAKELTDYHRQLASATGMTQFAHLGVGLLGGAAGSGLEMLVSGGASALSVARLGAAASKLQVLSTAAAGGVAGDAASAYLRQQINQSETSVGRVLTDTATSAIFSVPGVAVAAKQAFSRKLQMGKLDEHNANLMAAIDSDEAKPIIEAHAANINEIKAKLVAQAEKDGDDIAAAVWANAGPSAKAADIDRVIRDMHQAQRTAQEQLNTNVIPDAVEFHRPDTATTPLGREVTRYAKELTEQLGLTVSPEAASIIHRANKTWDDNIPESLKAMQKNLDDFYAVRKDKLKDLGGAAHWLDSSGLTFQLSKSRVTRMLGALLTESASGKGKREFSAALDYEKMRNHIEHKYVPALKEAMWAHFTTAERAKSLVGGLSKAERAFWYDAQLDRLQRREHIKNKMPGEYQSQAPKEVQEAGKLLDAVWFDSANNMKTRGHAEGEAILGGGFVGHVPYHFDSKEVARMFREEPKKFQAIRGLLKAQFDNKVLSPALADLNKNWDTYLETKITSLRGDIAALQEQMQAIEPARRAVQEIRDTVADVDAKRKELNATIEVITKQEKALKEELELLRNGDTHGARNAADEAAWMETTKNDWSDFNDDVAFKDEIARYDAADFLRALGARVNPDSEEHILLLQLLSTLGDDLPPAPMVVRSLVDPNVGSYFSRNGNKAFISLRTAAAYKMKPGMAAEEVVSRLLDDEVYIAMHEFWHYRTSMLLAAGKQGRASDAVNAAYQKIEALRKDVEYVLRDRIAAGDLPGTKYAISNVDEFTAQFFNSAEFREVLRKQKYKGDTVLNQFLEFLLDIVGVTKQQNTMYNELHNAMTTLLDSHGRVAHMSKIVKYAPPKLERVDATSYLVTAGDKEHMLVKGEGGWYSDDFAGGLEPAGKTPKQAAATLAGDSPEATGQRAKEIEEQLAALASNKATLSTAHKESVANTKAALAARAGIKETSGAKEVRQIERQLNIKKAALSDIEADPAKFRADTEESITNAALKKSDDLTSNYLRAIMTDQASRMSGKELNFADYAKQILMEDWKDERVTQQIADDFREKLSERLADRTRTELDLAKSVDVDGAPVRLLDFLEVDGLAQAKRAAHSTSGKAALARKGLGEERMREAAMEAMRATGATQKEVDDMRFIMGVYSGGIDPGENAQAWSAWRNFVAAARLGKLSEAMLADIPNVITSLGVSALPSMLGRMAGQVLSGKAFVHNGGLTDFGKQLTEVAGGTMGMDYRLHTQHAEGGAGESAVHDASWYSRFASRGSQLTGFLSLSNTVNEVVHRAATPMIAEELISAVATGKSAFTDARLADAGLSPENLALIQKHYAKHDAARKPGERVNWDKWEGEEGQYAADVLIGAIHRATYQTIQKGLIGEKPVWATKTQLGQTVAQLHTFGMVAAEKQAARNLAHGDGNTAVGFTVGITWASLLYMARVHANALDKPHEQQEEYKRRMMSGATFAVGVMSLWNASGIMPEALALGKTLWGNKEEVDGKVEMTPRGGGPVAAIGYAGDVAAAAGSVGNWARGVEDTSKMLKQTTSILPGGNSRLMSIIRPD